MSSPKGGGASKGGGTTFSRKDKSLPAQISRSDNRYKGRLDRGTVGRAIR